jgi:predicted secreted protein
MSETHTYDNLIAGSQKAIVQRPATVAISQAWSRGQVVARVTATGKWQIADEDATANYDDVGIAVEAVDTTDGTERNTTVYVEGEFNENELLVQYSDAVGDWREKLAGHGIYIRSARTTEGT